MDKCPRLYRENVELVMPAAKCWSGDHGWTDINNRHSISNRLCLRALPAKFKIVYKCYKRQGVASKIVCRVSYI